MYVCDPCIVRIFEAVGTAQFDGISCFAHALLPSIGRMKYHTLPIFSRSLVIVDHHNIMSICQTGRPVDCAQCAWRTEAHCSASLRALRFSAAHCSPSLRAVRFAHWSAIQRTKEGASVRRTAVQACAQCASRTEAPSNGLRKYHRRERHDPQSRGLLKFNNI